MPSKPSKPRKAPRQSTPSAEKVRIFAAYDAAASPIERAEIMRREGAYSSLLSNWRKQIAGSAQPKRGRPRNEESEEIDRLKREIEKLKARAERAEGLVETLGKAHALLQNAVNRSVAETQQSNKLS